MSAPAQGFHPDIPTLHEKVKQKKIAVVYAGWNPEITESMAAAAQSFLRRAGIAEANIYVHRVPGSYELPLGAQYAIEAGGADAVLALGCLIQGETDHYQFIAESVSAVLVQLQARYQRPIAFGVLTCHNMEQARARAGGNVGNKGEEAADAALRMLNLREEIKEKAHPKHHIGFGGQTS